MNSTLFIRRLFTHLASLGILLNEVSIQSGNGSEFPRNGLDLTQPSAFEKAIMDVKVNYIRIPPGAKNHQSDIERANGLIEYELLEIERWRTKS
ncbi:MAG: hypothetical protein IIA61_09820 [Candidatus Marinimicrobia bacterium]|nr:hypothetical protein [Candidatus Neomarinimicrobiota bacterium]